VSRFRLNLNIRGIEGPALLAVLIVVATRAIGTAPGLVDTWGL